MVESRKSKPEAEATAVCAKSKKGKEMSHKADEVSHKEHRYVSGV